MADTAGLATGVVTTWQTCVQWFDLIDSSRCYGMDYEGLAVKLELERVRLLIWGQSVGLNEGEDNIRLRHEVALQRMKVDDLTLQILGGIRHIFEHTEKIGQSLSPSTPAPPGEEVEDREIPSRPSQLVLGTVFMSANDTLRDATKSRECHTPMTREAMWAIYNSQRFEFLVSEVKSLNDTLEMLFPDTKIKTTTAITNDIEKSVDKSALLTLQKATSTDHPGISKTASIRLEVLGASHATRSETSDTARTVIEDQKTVLSDRFKGKTPQQTATASEGGEGTSKEDRTWLEEQITDCEADMAKRAFGSLGLTLNGPNRSSSKVTARVSHWRSGTTERPLPHWQVRDTCVVKSSHVAFDSYHRKRYIKKPPDSRYVRGTTEDDNVPFDVESQPWYESANPGTTTVEGYGMEAWEYEIHFGEKRDNFVVFSQNNLPIVSSSKILRRIDELQRGTNGAFGSAPEHEEADLIELFGNMGVTSRAQQTAEIRLGDILAQLNREDVFANFTENSSIGSRRSALKMKGAIGLWNFLWQIILAKELHLRLQSGKGVAGTGYTPRVVASLIVQDLWLRNVEIVLEDVTHDISQIPAPKPDEKEKAEEFKIKGNEAIKAEKWQQAADLYTEAMQLDSRNAIYRSNRSAAMTAMGRYKEAEHDASWALSLDPTYAKAWARRGMAELKRGASKRAKASYTRAMELAGNSATGTMKQGLADSTAKVEAEIVAFMEERTPDIRNRLRKEHLDQHWDFSGKVAAFHSRVHEQQVDGLLVFAERIRWPYINETRNFAELVYGNMQAGEIIHIGLHDWLYGLTLPGSFFSFKIMSALILCTPFLSEQLGTAPLYECGLVIEQRSYWRARTVLARVLGSLPGVVSLCGWIGPCPPVEFEPPHSSEEMKRPRHIRLKARQVPPAGHIPQPEAGVEVKAKGRPDLYEETLFQPCDDSGPYIAEMKDEGNWIIPEPPVRELGTISVKAVKLMKLPLDLDIAAKSANKSITEKEVERELQYRASTIFTLGNSQPPVTYTLYTNPVFVSLPPCDPGPKGLHEVHIRELPRYQKNVWSAERLKDHVGGADDYVLIINATSQGAETLARAWCSERSKHAVIRRARGPCYVCAVRAASEMNLGTKVLIWVS